MEFSGITFYRCAGNCASFLRIFRLFGNYEQTNPVTQLIKVILRFCLVTGATLKAVNEKNWEHRYI